LRRAALVAGAVLTVTGRGDLWTLALAFGVAEGSALVAFVVAAVGVATLARTGSAALVDISGAQAVLGAAGFTGSAAAIAASWTSVLALLAIARDRWTSVALGVLAATVVAGPALSGGSKSAAVLLVGLVAGGTVGYFLRPSLARRPWHVVVDVGMAVVTVALGVLAGYH
jgi:hypothetical protein